MSPPAMYMLFSIFFTAFDADVADANTDTKAEDFRQDLEITVASLEVFGKTN